MRRFFFLVGLYSSYFFCQEKDLHNLAVQPYDIKNTVIDFVMQLPPNSSWQEKKAVLKDTLSLMQVNKEFKQLINTKKEKLELLKKVVLLLSPDARPTPKDIKFCMDYAVQQNDKIALDRAYQAISIGQKDAFDSGSLFELCCYFPSTQEKNLIFTNQFNDAVQKKYGLQKIDYEQLQKYESYETFIFWRWIFNCIVCPCYVGCKNKPWQKGMKGARIE
ncbi:MAG: hypothetical protein AB7R69_04165 [Candidatus Babeliales bacterium]